MVLESDYSATVLAYHARTMHRMERYAAGPETLDWDAQPAPFRRYAGARSYALPLLSEADLAAGVLTQAFSSSEIAPRAEWTLARLGALLQVSFGITAWKSYGPDRWAVRANPSSGNLHPIEAYVITSQLAGLEDGVYHYDPEAHALELRASWRQPPGAQAAAPALYIALSSVMWREAWKYGERAFRYCQLDAGHAVGAVTIAAAALGAQVRADLTAAHATLTSLLGLDRDQDYPRSRKPEHEREEAELLLQFDLNSRHSRLPQLEELTFYGVASLIDPRPMYQWPVIDEVAQATRAQTERDHYAAQTSTEAPQLLPTDATPATSAPPVHSVLLGRRSAQRFDNEHVASLEDLVALLAPLMPNTRGPWAGLSTTPGIDLILFIHRVAGLEPGLYYLPRRGAHSQTLSAQLAADFKPQALPNVDPSVPLLRLAAIEPKQLMRLARALHCHQDIAASGCFALGMLAEFSPRVTQSPASYRDLFREAGLIGQLLYLHAEARGLRGTGIGCYFDGAVHELLGLRDTRHQSLYHFTVGRAIEDARIETAPAYPTAPRT